MPLYKFFAQFVECTSTDCKQNGITKKKVCLSTVIMQRTISSASIILVVRYKYT
jgi:hypothetical protein